MGVGPGSIIAERYRLLRAIGEGNMGIVFEASMQNGARVALKLLVVGEGAAMVEARARFLRESALSFSLRAPHVVAVHDHGIDGRTGVPFMAMDLLVGEDLDALVKRVGAIEPEVAVRIFMQACEGLAAAHARGIVHRDVKPSNLFLCRTNDGRIDVRVCDFGAAKIFGGEQLTRAGALVGTPLFIPPEQLRNAKEADARSDVWSLGMSLYFALTGAPALDHVKSFAELATILVSGAIPPLQRTAPWIAGDLARAVHGTILSNVDARCPSARDFGAILARCIAGHAEIAAASLVPIGAASRAIVRDVVILPASWSEVVATTPVTPAPRASSAQSASSAPPAPRVEVASTRRPIYLVVALALILLTVVAVAGAVALWLRFA